MAHGPAALSRDLTASISTSRAGTSLRLFLRAAWLAVLVTTTAFASAQTAGDAANAYAIAEEALAAATAVPLGRAPSPDDPAWRDALQAATGAADAAVRAAAAVVAADPADEAARVAAQAAVRRAYRLEAHAYGLTNWYSRAFVAWDAFLAAGGELTDAGPSLPGDPGTHLLGDRDEYRRVVGQLAFARYEAGDLEEARGWYLTLLDRVPDDPEALRWLARIAYERDDTSAAVIIWQRLLEVAPDDEGARFFLELTKERERYGVAASEAYRSGIRAYESGRLEPALKAFQAAAEANPSFVDAAVWAGRTALELEEPELAVGYWERAVNLDPADSRSAWFLDYARLEAEWGVEAGRAYYGGLAAYEADDLEGARKLFVAATQAAPEFKEAFVWAARTTQELGAPDEAIAYWQVVLRLDRDDERARYFIANARRAIRYGPEAGGAFARGLAAYQAGDGPTAQAEFEAATEAAPEFLQAWAYLGQVAFQNRDYVRAGAAYRRAAALDPGDDDYAFFAGEAERLAENERSEPR